MSIQTNDLDLAGFSEQNQNNQYVTFILGDDFYGMNINSVKEVIEYGAVTTIPLMPDFVKGVLNLRGEVVPVLDLSLRFGKEKTEIHQRSCIAIIEVTHDERVALLGVVVDSVNEVVEVLPEQIENPPSFGAQIRAQFIVGVANIDEHFVIILDSEKVLSVDEMADIIDHAIN